MKSKERSPCSSSVSDRKVAGSSSASLRYLLRQTIFRFPLKLAVPRASLFVPEVPHQENLVYVKSKRRTRQLLELKAKKSWSQTTSWGRKKKLWGTSSTLKRGTKFLVPQSSRRRRTERWRSTTCPVQKEERWKAYKSSITALQTMESSENTF